MEHNHENNKTLTQNTLTLGKAISAAFIKAQSEFGPALKTSTNPHFRSRYAGLDACVEAVIDSLHKYGLGLIQRTLPHENGVAVETIFIHTSGETMSGGVLQVPASKQDPQGYGSALTYARRYSLITACGIAPEDDDGNAASQALATIKPQKTTKPAPKKQQVETDDDPIIPSGKDRLAMTRNTLEADERIPF